MGGVRKFEECNELNGRIWERDKGRRSMMNREEKRKTEGGGGRIESKSRRVQEEWVTGEVYGKNFV